MRPLLFVAVVPPAAALSELRRAVDELRGSTSRLRWEASSRWHVTLCFLGPVEPTGPMSARLGDVAARHPPVPLRLAGGGHFGHRVLWAGLAGDLEPLADAVRGAAVDSGIELESRPFRAHLTLARAGRGTRLTVAAEVVDRVPERAFVAREIVLLRSGRPDYERLEAWPLRG